ncbi:MAG: type II secretion system F family protein [Bacilli bacterium]|jgi:tight adherence protein C|nr:type II secretion system F family protein [Bacilli bacterium]
MKKEKSLVRRIYLEKTIQKVEQKIDLLGIYCHYNAIDLLNYRLLISIAIFSICLIVLKEGYIVGPLLTLIFYVGSEYLLLDIPIKKREKKLEEEAVFFFEVLSLTLESGRNLNAALDITAANIDNELSAEFKKALAEIHLGKSFTESITDMKKRIPSDTINNALLNITQSSIFGNSILESLNNQLDFLREKRILEVKSEIAKLPTKISAISVVFFIPIMLLVILTPVVLEFLFG